MERAEWLKEMRRKAETLYDKFAPAYWVTYGFYEAGAQQEFIKKLLARIPAGGSILSGACGAGRFDGLLLEGGHSVVGIDQSAGMLARAREHFPLADFPCLRYQKIGLQEMNFHEEFDGAICMDSFEHICPEDWPGILRGFHAALKPGGLFYFNADERDSVELENSYRRARALGLPVVYGEVADQVDALYDSLMSQTGIPTATDACVYHFVPSPDQVRAWLAEAGFAILEESASDGYHHFMARKTG